jgi:cell division protein FtsI/penicillin-binding protein 2
MQKDICFPETPKQGKTLNLTIDEKIDQVLEELS